MKTDIPRVHAEQAASRQTDAALAHICFHHGLGRQLADAVLEQNAQHADPQQQPPAHSNDAQPLETLLQRLAAICAAPEPPEADYGTQRGGEETVRWLIEELAMAARHCNASAAAGDGAGAAKSRHVSSTLAGAVEVIQYADTSIPARQSCPSVSPDRRLWSLLLWRQLCHPQAADLCNACSRF